MSLDLCSCIIFLWMYLYEDRRFDGDVCYEGL